MAPGLLSRAELPPWCTKRVDPDMPARFAVFFDSTETWPEVREYTFIVDRTGRVCFGREVHYRKTGVSVDPSPVSHLPPEVLIAAGVEALRRAGRGS